VDGVEALLGTVKISAAGGWAQVMFNALITGADNTSILGIPFGTTVIPLLPNVRYGFHVEGNTRYQRGTTTDPVQVSDHILSVMVADNASYNAPPPTLPNNPRRFAGAVSYPSCHSSMMPMMLAQPKSSSHQGILSLEFTLLLLALGSSEPM
jgi:hypothetical protein